MLDHRILVNNGDIELTRSTLPVEFAMRLFGNQLVKMRQERNLRVGELAALLGCHPSYITHLEKGRRHPPRIEDLRRLAMAMHLSAPDLQTLQQAAIWTAAVTRVEDLGFSPADTLLHDAASNLFDQK
ncbi:MAG: hypothetical protein CML16_17270 [Pusillimonas sp.]|nr:hypothetical protein [Pusillimonas sp.]MBC44120.1 hypothetical protein [Pusillimonas sp.]HCP77524.1 hypothetical protein [Pusillimonas sp.]